MLVVRGSISSPGLLEWSRCLPSSAPLGEVILPSYRGTVVSPEGWKAFSDRLFILCDSYHELV